MTQDSKTLLTKLRSNLRRLGTDLAIAGDEGEALTRVLLDDADVGWFGIEQEPDTKGEGLKTAGAKRVDFVVGWNGASILLDTKCQHHATDPDGSIIFKLEVSEVERLRKTGELFGLDVAVIFWSRVMTKEKFVIDRLGRLTDTATIRDSKTGKEKSALSARFHASEVCELTRD